MFLLIDPQSSWNVSFVYLSTIINPKPSIFYMQMHRDQYFGCCINIWEGSLGSTNAWLLNVPFLMSEYIPLFCVNAIMLLLNLRTYWISLLRWRIKVSQPPLLNHNLKWQCPGSRFWKGPQLPFRYVVPKRGNYTFSPYSRKMGISNDQKSGVGLELTNTILWVERNA